LFTFKDIIALAVQIENNGEEIYRRAMQRNASPELCDLLSWIADEEARHGEWFEALGRRAPPTAVDGAMEKMGRIMLRSTVEEQSFSLDEFDLSRTADAERVLIQSIEFEEDTVAFYQMMLPFLQDPEAIDALNRIIEEERRHIEQLQKMRAALKTENA